MMLMDMACEYAKEKPHLEETHKRINQVRLLKKVYLPCEILGINGRSSTKCFSNKYEIIPLRWWFIKSNIKQPNKGYMKVWHYFLEFLVSKRIDFTNNIYIYICDVWNWKIIHC